MYKYVFFLVSFFFIIQASNKHNSEGKTYKAFVPPPLEIKHFSFGYKESIADSLWIRFIQDMDECGEFENQKNTNKKKSCNMGWGYRMLDAISELAPRFESVYLTGATVLSVVGNDAKGAEAIFDKGIKVFPGDWSISYRAGYHYLVEMKDYKKAAEALKLAAENGAPSWVYSLAGRLYTQTGQALLTKTMLESFLKRNPKVKYSNRIRQRLIEANRALGLSSKKGDFSKPFLKEREIN